MAFNPQDPAFIQNPYPTFARLHAESPIFYDAPTQLWMVARHADVNALLRDRRLGRAIDHVLPPAARGVSPPPPEHEPFTRLSTHSLFDKEPPDHTRLRRLVQKAFTPRRVQGLNGRIETIAHQLIDALPAGEPFDFLEQFAVPLPVTVIAELLGVPPADRHRLRPWSEAIVAMYELNPGTAVAARAVRAAVEFSDALRRLAAQRRAAPQDDLITALALVEDGGDILSEDELIATGVLLLNAGHEATVNALGNGLWTLLQHPDQLRALQQNPALIPKAIEEMLRYDTPLQLFRRWVLADFTYQGHRLRQGEQIGLLFGAANRDPARFPQPHQFDINRGDDSHITFGAGIHYCLGAPLARLELHIALHILLTRLPTLRLAEPLPRYKSSFVIRGLDALWLRR